MTVLEVGPGMGYFSLPLARLVGEKGKVICPDVETRMLDRLERRAAKAGVSDRIVPIHAAEESLRIEGYEGRADFALAFAVVHEVPDQAGLWAQIHRSLKPGSLVLFSEPTGHVSESAFDDSVEIAKGVGFTTEASVDVRRTRSVLLKQTLGSAKAGRDVNPTLKGGVRCGAPSRTSSAARTPRPAGRSRPPACAP